MLLPRRLLWAPPLVRGRSYSYFSQKPGGGSGRFFNSSKPPKTPPRSGKPPAASNGAPTVVSTRATNEADTSPNNVNPTPDHPHVAGVDSKDETNTSTSLSSTSPPSSSTSLSSSAPPSSLSGSDSPVPFHPSFHPHPPLPSLHLHSFFSQHRPLLLLDQPVSSLFRPSPPSVLGGDINANADAAENPSVSDNVEETGMEDPEADADTARLLARAMVVQRVQSSRDWATVLSNLGLESEDMIVEMDSVKRKRRKKITKHKYKKRRKLQRAERRRLGK